MTRREPSKATPAPSQFQAPNIKRNNGTIKCSTMENTIKCSTMENTRMEGCSSKSSNKEGFSGSNKNTSSSSSSAGENFKDAIMNNNVSHDILQQAMGGDLLTTISSTPLIKTSCQHTQSGCSHEQSSSRCITGKRTSQTIDSNSSDLCNKRRSSACLYNGSNRTRENSVSIRNTVNNCGGPQPRSADSRIRSTSSLGNTSGTLQIKKGSNGSITATSRLWRSPSVALRESTVTSLVFRRGTHNTGSNISLLRRRLMFSESIRRNIAPYNVWWNNTAALTSGAAAPRLRSRSPSDNRGIAATAASFAARLRNCHYAKAAAKAELTGGATQGDPNLDHSNKYEDSKVAKPSMLATNENTVSSSLEPQQRTSSIVLPTQKPQLNFRCEQQVHKHKEPPQEAHTGEEQQQHPTDCLVGQNQHQLQQQHKQQQQQQLEQRQQQHEQKALWCAKREKQENRPLPPDQQEEGGLTARRFTRRTTFLVKKAGDAIQTEDDIFNRQQSRSRLDKNQTQKPQQIYDGMPQATCFAPDQLDIIRTFLEKVADVPAAAVAERSAALKAVAAAAGRRILPATLTAAASTPAKTPATGTVANISVAAMTATGPAGRSEVAVGNKGECRQAENRAAGKAASVCTGKEAEGGNRVFIEESTTTVKTVRFQTALSTGVRTRNTLGECRSGSSSSSSLIKENSTNEKNSTSSGGQCLVATAHYRLAGYKETEGVLSSADVFANVVGYNGVHAVVGVPAAAPVLQSESSSSNMLGSMAACSSCSTCSGPNSPTCQAAHEFSSVHQPQNQRPNNETSLLQQQQEEHPAWHDRSALQLPDELHALTSVTWKRNQSGSGLCCFLQQQQQSYQCNLVQQQPEQRHCGVMAISDDKHKPLPLLHASEVPSELQVAVLPELRGEMNAGASGNSSSTPPSRCGSCCCCCGNVFKAVHIQQRSTNDMTHRTPTAPAVEQPTCRERVELLRETNAVKQLLTEQEEQQEKKKEGRYFERLLQQRPEMRLLEPPEQPSTGTLLSEWENYTGAKTSFGRSVGLGGIGTPTDVFPTLLLRGWQHQHAAALTNGAFCFESPHIHQRAQLLQQQQLQHQQREQIKAFCDVKEEEVEMKDKDEAEQHKKESWNSHAEELHEQKPEERAKHGRTQGQLMQQQQQKDPQSGQQRIWVGTQPQQQQQNVNGFFNVNRSQEKMHVDRVSVAVVSASEGEAAATATTTVEDHRGRGVSFGVAASALSASVCGAAGAAPAAHIILERASAAAAAAASKAPRGKGRHAALEQSSHSRSVLERAETQREGAQSVQHVRMQQMNMQEQTNEQQKQMQQQQQQPWGGLEAINQHEHQQQQPWRMKAEAVSQQQQQQEQEQQQQPWGDLETIHHFCASVEGLATDGVAPVVVAPPLTGGALSSVDPPAVDAATSSLHVPHIATHASIFAPGAIACGMNNGLANPVSVNSPVSAMTGVTATATAGAHRPPSSLPQQQHQQQWMRGEYPLQQTHQQNGGATQRGEESQQQQQHCLQIAAPRNLQCLTQQEHHHQTTLSLFPPDPRPLQPTQHSFSPCFSLQQQPEQQQHHHHDHHHRHQQQQRQRQQQQQQQLTTGMQAFPSASEPSVLLPHASRSSCEQPLQKQEQQQQLPQHYMQNHQSYMPQQHTLHSTTHQLLPQLQWEHCQPQQQLQQTQEQHMEEQQALPPFPSYPLCQLDVGLTTSTDIIRCFLEPRTHTPPCNIPVALDALDPSPTGAAGAYGASTSCAAATATTNICGAAEGTTPTIAVPLCPHVGVPSTAPPSCGDACRTAAALHSSAVAPASLLASGFKSLAALAGGTDASPSFAPAFNFAAPFRGGGNSGGADACPSLGAGPPLGEAVFDAALFGGSATVAPCSSSSSSSSSSSFRASFKFGGGCGGALMAPFFSPVAAAFEPAMALVGTAVASMPFTAAIPPTAALCGAAVTPPSFAASCSSAMPFGAAAAGAAAANPPSAATPFAPAAISGRGETDDAAACGQEIAVSTGQKQYPNVATLIPAIDYSSNSSVCSASFQLLLRRELRALPQAPVFLSAAGLLLHSFLGNGGFSTVWRGCMISLIKGSSREKRVPVAVKCMRVAASRTAALACQQGGERREGPGEERCDRDKAAQLEGSVLLEDALIEVELLQSLQGVRGVVGLYGVLVLPTSSLFWTHSRSHNYYAACQQCRARCKATCFHPSCSNLQQPMIIRFPPPPPPLPRTSYRTGGGTISEENAEHQPRSQPTSPRPTPPPPLPEGNPSREYYCTGQQPMQLQQRICDRRQSPQQHMQVHHCFQGCRGAQEQWQQLRCPYACQRLDDRWGSRQKRYSSAILFPSQQSQRLEGQQQPQTCSREEDQHNDTAALLLVMELCEGGSLAKHLRGPGEGGAAAHALLSLRTRLSLALQLASILYDLHIRGIVHRDIKPENLLLNGRGELTLCDLGLSARLHCPYTTATAASRDLHDCTSCAISPGRRLRPLHRILPAGSPRYIAPEITTTRGAPLHFSMDMWSAGCVLLELFGASPPYYDCKSLEEVADRHAKRIRPAELPAGTPAELVHIIWSCLQFEASARWTSHQLLVVLREVAQQLLSPACEERTWAYENEHHACCQHMVRLVNEDMEGC